MAWSSGSFTLCASSSLPLSPLPPPPRPQPPTYRDCRPQRDVLQDRGTQKVRPCPTHRKRDL